MPNPATVREQCFRKTKAQLIDELESFERRVAVLRVGGDGDRVGPRNGPRWPQRAYKVLGAAKRVRVETPAGLLVAGCPREHLARPGASARDVLAVFVCQPSQPFITIPLPFPPEQFIPRPARLGDEHLNRSDDKIAVRRVG